MKQVTNFCENNQIYSTISLSIIERIKLLFMGALQVHIDQNNSSPMGSIVSYYQPKIKKSK